MSISDKLHRGSAGTSTIESKLNPFVSDMSTVLTGMGYSGVEVTPKYIPFYKTFLVLLGSKYYTQDQITLITCKKEASSYKFVVNLDDYSEGKETIDDDEFFVDNMEQFLADVIEDKKVQQKFELYQKISEGPFSLRIFAKELYLYLDDDIVVNDISQKEVLQLKEKKSLALKNDRFPADCDLLQLKGRYGELNGFVFSVINVEEHQVKLSLNE